MAPTIPPSFAFACATQPTTIVISSSDSSSLVCSVIILSSSSSADGDGATSRPRRGRYRCWELGDELKILDTIADLRRGNMGDRPPASALFRALQGARSPIRRRGLDVSCLSQKVYHLKKKFAKAAAKAAANGGKRLRKKRNRALFERSMNAWPDLLPPAAAAALKARAARRVRAACGGVRVGF